MTSRRVPAAATAVRGERWAVDAGAADVALLDVPPVLQQDRVFDVDVRFVVRPLPDGPPAWLAIDVEVDGVRQWSRRIDAHRTGASDSLDYHCRREVPAGRALRVRAVTRLGGAVRERLLIEAEVSVPGEA